MKNKLTTWGVAIVACTPLLAAAQAAETAAPKASTPLVYQSAFADYKPYKDVPLANWRALNDTVAGAAGGASGNAGSGMSGIRGMGQMPMPMGDTPATPAAAKPRHEGHSMHQKRRGGKP